MDEYILRHEAIRAVQLSYGNYEATRKAIFELPAADVAPVRHGRWVHEGNCTVCPFFHLCMFVEFPEDKIRKWLESEVETDV